MDFACEWIYLTIYLVLMAIKILVNEDWHLSAINFSLHFSELLN